MQYFNFSASFQRKTRGFLIGILGLLFHFAGAQTSSSRVFTQESAKEEDYFKIMRLPAPEGTVLEVGGLCTLPNGELAVTTRRGDIYIVENPTSLKPHFRKFASGLHEVLGIAYKNGSLYCAQRGELTKITDTNNDGKADLFKTIAALPVTGNYCEYNYGPKIAADGSFFITCNLAFPEDEWWRPYSKAPWRGWMLHIQEDGRIEPWATGMRSPAGIGMIDNQMFYADNQGDWIGSGGIIHVKKGAFTGNPAGLAWTSQANSPLKLTQEQLFAKVSPRFQKNENGQDIRPLNVADEKFTTLFELKKSIPEIALPAVWLPHGILGISNSEIVTIPENTFGPFAGQMLIGDQGQSKIMRVFMEKVNGEYQGAAWDFRSGFQSGVLRLAWAADGSLFVGETNRGWGSAGEATQGLQRLVWNNKVPFEMLAVRAMPDGFEIEFTKPVDRTSAADVNSYAVENFIYKYHPVYGSPPVNTQKCTIKGVKVSEDGLKVRIAVDNLRQNYIHTIYLPGVLETENAFSLVHPTTYYTLNNIPEGERLTLTPTSIRKPAVANPAKKTPTIKTAGASKAGSPTPSLNAGTSVAKTPSFELVKPLLAKYTCLACHSPDRRQVGPAYQEVAKRKYPDEKIVNLIHNPQPENWPDYATPMPPMPQVPREDALKIAAWINSLSK